MTIESTSTPTEVDVNEVLDEALGLSDSGEPLAEDVVPEDEQAAPAEDEPEAVEDPDKPKQETESKDQPKTKVTLTPEARKELWSKHPELKDEHFALRAHREVFGNISDAREIRQMFPTNEEAREAADAAARLHEIDVKFRTDQKDFANELAEGDPEAFQRLVAEGMSVLYERDPQLYQEVVELPFVNAISTAWHQRAMQTGDRELAAAMEVIQERLRVGYRQTHAARVEQFGRRAEAEQREQAGRASTARQEFLFDVSDGVRGQCEKDVDKLVNDAAPTLSPAAKGEIRSRVIQAVSASLEADNLLQQKIRHVVDVPGLAPADRKAKIVSLMRNRATGLIRTHFAETLDWFTKDVLAVTPKPSNGREPRIDPGSGTKINSGGKQPTADEMRSMSPDEIFNSLGL